MSAKIISFEQRKNRSKDINTTENLDIDSIIAEIDSLHNRLVGIQNIVDPKVKLFWN